MDYRVIISKPALGDLEGISRFIAQSAHGSPTVALKIGEELIAQTESLAALPNRGAAVRHQPGVRKLSHRYYLTCDAENRLPVVSLQLSRRLYDE